MSVKSRILLFQQIITQLNQLGKIPLNSLYILIKIPRNPKYIRIVLKEIHQRLRYQRKTILHLQINIKIPFIRLHDPGSVENLRFWCVKIHSSHYLQSAQQHTVFLLSLVDDEFVRVHVNGDDP